MSVVSRVAIGGLLLSSLALYAGDKANKVVRELHVLSVSPGSSEELWDDAELVVHVRVLGGHAKTTPNADFVHTEHRARVLEVFKSEVSPECATQAPEPASCAPLVGQELGFLQIAGEVETEAAVLRIMDAVPLKPGAEYVLYLRWNPHLKAFIATYGANGMFEIVDDVVRPSAEWVESQHAGKSAAKFKEELRRKRSRK